MKRLEIPASEKAKGMLWVEYQACAWHEEWKWDPYALAKYWEPDCIVELEIRPGKN